MQEPLRHGQRRFGLLTRAANDDEVVCPSCQPVAGLAHGLIERVEEYIRPERTRDPALRDPRLGRLPSVTVDYACGEKAADQLQHASIADLFCNQTD